MRIFRRRQAGVEIDGATIFLTKAIFLSGKVKFDVTGSNIIIITKTQRKEVDRLFNKFAKDLSKDNKEK